MKKYLTILVALLVATFINAQPTDKKLIDTSEVSHVEIVKFNTTDPARSPTKKLNKMQYSDLAQKWNSATALGADKYKMTYYIYLFSKTGQKRQFTISGNKIQETGWLTYDIKDKNYFDKIWNEIK